MSAILFHGGRIHTSDGRRADALLTRDGRVAAVGRTEDLARDAAGAERIDLRGGAMYPGWTDAHVHFMWWSIQTRQLDLRDTDSVDAALDAIAAHSATLAPDAWVLGGRFSKDRWGRWPTAAELDRATGGRPASLRSRDGHSRWVSTRTLELAGVTRDTPVPAGGAIDRDDAGELTGILKENAMRLVDRVVPPPSDDECLAAVRQGQEDAWRAGITGIEDLEQASAFRAFQRLHESGGLGLRVDMGVPHVSLDAALALGLRTGLGDDWLRVGHLKIFTDGALGSQTAALDDPYEDSDDRGILTIEPDVLDADVRRAAEAGIAVAIHAIGDRAVATALDAIAPTRQTHPQLRQKVEHLQLLRQADIARFGALGVIASMQPIHATSDRDLVDRYWGSERAARAYPWRSLADGGATLAFGSDAPVEPIDPLVGIHAAVARRRPGDADVWHPEQRLTLDEALAAYAAGPAYAAGREDLLGSLEVGKWCDATIVDRDLSTCDENDMLDARVTGTVTGGILRFAEGLG